ncbi:MAG: DUF3618 domain-containing protein [Janthinobacterium lividum]
MADQTTSFETEAEATRDRIAATMDDLQNRLSPRTIVSNAVDSISASGSDALATVKSAIGSHPLALAAAGLAVGVTQLARSKVRGASIENGDSYAAYSDYDDSYAANLADEPGSNSARARIEALHHQAHATVDDNPLAVVLVGLATGALLGSIIPVSDAENDMLGGARDRIASAARAAADAARDEFDLAKLSLKGGPAGMIERASQSLGSIAQAARDDLHRPAHGVSG